MLQLLINVLFTYHGYVYVPNNSSKCQLKLTARTTNAHNDTDDIKLTNSDPQKRLLGTGGSKRPIQIHYFFA